MKPTSHLSDCLAEYYRTRRLGQRRGELQKYLEQACDASDPRNYGAETRTEVIVRSMMTRFGGLDKFVGFWFEFLQHARANGKEHLVQRSLESLARFIELTDRNKADQPTGDTSEEGARELLKEHLVRMVFEDPSVGATILEELGWKVQPPEEAVEAEASGPLHQRLEANISDG